MSFLGKKFPAPVAKPMAPFFIADKTANYKLILMEIYRPVMMYGINSFGNMMMANVCTADEFKNDPRNPNAKTAKPADKH
ncbi:hypothetical protein LSUE1_G008582 [Lachnellula suecica]|uniref:Uncharacterized protein n=1 Tax=Lachnellula suecica TaxID=602035 RepID=A0A8T9BRK6_9HELO|nr:hypothetical protein LSUE1_G008582 [Lachnellula suecica]